MKRACIAIVDGGSARIYTYQQRDGEQPTLNEEVDLVNPGRRAKDEELFSDTKPGSRVQEGGRGGTDDHRDAHRAMWDAEFAESVIGEIEKIVNEQGFDHVILVASPKMTGHLRTQDTRLTKRGIVVDEIVRDLAKLTSPQIHDHLAALKVIDPRPRPGFARR